MKPKLSAIGLIAAWLAAATAWAQPPKVVLVQGRALVDVESLSDEFGNRVMPIEPDESPTEAINKATVNTAAINRFFSKFGSSTGETRGLYLNGRLYAINDTIIEGASTWEGMGGMVIDGGGGRTNSVPALNTLGFTAAATTGMKLQSVGGFVWVGNPDNLNQPYTDKPMIALTRGYGSRIDNCQFMGWRKAAAKPRQPTRISEMVRAAIEIGHTVGGVSTAKHSFHNCSFLFCQHAYEITGDDHADNVCFSGFQTFDGCPYVLRASAGNEQAVGYGGGAYWMVHGPFDPVRICSFDKGGKVHFDSVKMVANGTIFETMGVNSLASDFSCDRLWWDHNALQNDGAVFPHINFENGEGGTDKFDYTASATTASPTILTLGGGLTAKQEDEGKLLVITSGTGGWILNDDNTPYVVTEATDGGSTWTLDRPCVSGSNGSAMRGYAGVRSYNRLVDMQETGAAFFDISGHLSLDGDTELPNLVRLKDSVGFKPVRVQLNVMNLHRATARCYGKYQPALKANPFVVPSSCKLFIDVNQAWEQDTTGTPLLDYAGKSTGSHGDISNAELLTLNDVSGTGNHLSAFDTGLGFYNWAMNARPCIVGANGKGLRKTSPTALTGLTALSVGGVIRRTADWSSNQAIAGVWYPNGSQKVWEVDTNSSEQFRLWLSTNGTTDSATITFTGYTIPLDRNIPFYIVWNGTTAVLYIEIGDPISQSAVVGTLRTDVTAPLYVGCTSSNGTSPNNPFIGAIGTIMVDSTVLDVNAIKYRFEEFAARYGTPINTDL